MSHSGISREAKRVAGGTADNPWSIFDNTKGLVPAGAPGWSEKNIRAVLASSLQTFPECGFAVGAFDQASNAPTKILLSEGTEPSLVSLFEHSEWHADWLAGPNIGGIVDIPVGLRGLAPFSDENQDTIFGARHLLIFAMPGPMKVMFAIWRSADFGRFREPEMGPLREKAQSVASIIRLATEVAATHLAELGANLDRLRLGFLVIDDALRMNFANAAAAEMLQHGHYVFASDNLLKLADQMSEARLRQLIAHVAPLSRQSPDSTGVVAIRAATGDNLARCIVNVHRDLDDSLLGRPQFALTVSAQYPSGTQHPGQLRRLGFTPAEAELVADLMKGLTVTQHAQGRGIAVATARAHLKRAMMRVGVHRQADLIRHILGLS